MANVSFSRLSALSAVLSANMVYIVSVADDQFELVITGDCMITVARE